MLNHGKSGLINLGKSKDDVCYPGYARVVYFVLVVGVMLTSVLTTVEIVIALTKVY